MPRVVSVLLLLVSLVWLAPRWATAQDEWATWVARAATAVSVGDAATAREAIALLRSHGQRSPVPDYLAARLAERNAAWDEALARYRGLLTNQAIVMDEEWVGLVSGRWVRADRAADAGWIRALSGGVADTLHAGRCLVLPPEILLLEVSAERSAVDLDALATALAAWVTIGLRQTGLATPIGRQATALLQRGAGLRPGGVRLPSEVTSADGEAIPPVTAALGIARRLAQLAPAGPPPWNPDGPRPAAYLPGPPDAQWTFAIEQALIHFQREYGLAPTGIPDAETRQALERAYRQAQARVRIAPAAESRTDPATAVARLAGAEAVWTGTLEPLADGGIAWNLVWVSARDGSLLCDPLHGVLVPDAFAAAWTHLVRQSLRSSPFCARSPSCEEWSVPPAPTLAGAVSYGRALRALADGAEEQAAREFAEAARRGAGEGARWYARAWARSESALMHLERRLLEREIFGPIDVEARLLEASGDGLAAGIWRGTGLTPDILAERHRPSCLQALPERGWLQIIGSLP